MKRIKSLLCAVLAAVRVLGAVPAHAASGFSDYYYHCHQLKAGQIF